MELIKPGDALATPEQRMAVKIDELNAKVLQLTSVVAILEQKLVLDKGFYDQIKVHKPEEPKKEVAEAKEPKKEEEKK